MATRKSVYEYLCIKTNHEGKQTLAIDKIRAIRNTDLVKNPNGINDACLKEIADKLNIKTDVDNLQLLQLCISESSDNGAEIEILQEFNKEAKYKDFNFDEDFETSLDTPQMPKDNFVLPKVENMPESLAKINEERQRPMTDVSNIVDVVAPQMEKYIDDSYVHEILEINCIILRMINNHDVTQFIYDRLLQITTTPQYV